MYTFVHILENGNAICAFVVLNTAAKPSQEMEDAIKAHMVEQVGAIARPKQIRFVEAVPKTRSGKIMRRLLKELAITGRITGDITTLEDLSLIAKLTK